MRTAVGTRRLDVKRVTLKRVLRGDGPWEDMMTRGVEGQDQQGRPVDGDLADGESGG